jgi:hypothetical protein
MYEADIAVSVVSFISNSMGIVVKTNVSKDEPSIIFTRNRQRTSQHGNKNIKSCNWKSYPEV